MTTLKNSYVLYEGPSLIDGKPIVVFATGFTKPSMNAKLGYDTISTYIMRSDISPTDAVKSGDDFSICGHCPHRPSNNGTCYVNVFHAPLAVWKSWKRGNVPTPTQSEYELLLSITRDKLLRLGSYGDPMSVPHSVFLPFILECKKHTGYTHQWSLKGIFNYPTQSYDFYKTYCMASCDNIWQSKIATRKGWKTFRVATTFDIPQNETVCPGKCSKCNLCSAKFGNVFVTVHGTHSKVNKFNQV